jgi:(1->4)-alpha-D-glucan 1-alpha-D-glucosylmutase
VKALREAKETTSWLAPDEAYEAEVTAFAQRILFGRDAAFVREMDAFAGRVAELGAGISLGQLAAKLIAPGAPDIYWGNEVTQLTLVDPDNRRPIDFDANARLLAELRTRHADDPARLMEELAATMPDGRLKLLLTHLGLQLRRRRADLFRDGRYVPLDTRPHDAPVYSAARRLDNRWVVAIARLRPYRSVGAELLLPDGAPARLRDVLSGREIGGPVLDLSELLSDAPVALLEITET